MLSPAPLTLLQLPADVLRNLVFTGDLLDGPTLAACRLVCSRVCAIIPKPSFCSGCHQAFSSSERTLTALGRRWHPQHFVCHVGNEPLLQQFFVWNGVPLCRKHYTEVGVPLCFKCMKPVSPVAPFQALGNYWHPEHCMNLP
jgi:hypothetical protein